MASLLNPLPQYGRGFLFCIPDNMKDKAKFKVDNTVLKIETAVLVVLVPKDQSDEQTNEYLDELEFLAETDGVKTLKRFSQRLPHPDNKTYVGKGKLEEIKK